MRLALNPAGRRLLRTLPRTSVYSLLELLLLSLLAIQCARLVWAMVTPVGPFGEWRAESDRPAVPGGAALLSSFDPFFRLAPDSGTAVVTSLALRLYGVREDRASGRGSAIIATPDGKQRSFAVGDELVPGVILKAVGFDNVTITRNGADEQLFMDQSGGADVVGAPPIPSPGATPGPPVMTPLPVVTTPAPPASNLSSEVSIQPRLNGSRLTGVTVQPRGSGEAFRAAGLAPGDVIISVNGERLTSPAQAAGLAGRLTGDARVQVERNGRVIPLTIRGGR
jgi:general secretion pathway protein C